jgi:quercetin dioxygenase-like cupin family protein
MRATLNVNSHPQHTDWSGVPVEQIEEGIWRQMIVGEKMMVCRLRFAPHIVTPPHDHPHEQITLVEKGPVLFTVGDEERIAQTGDVLHFPPNSWHGATMLDEEVLLIDIFSPVREDFLTSSQFYGNGSKHGKQD